MGNKIGKRRPVVEEKYTRPQGLYQHRDIDHKKLRKLILDCKLAPCYAGNEECNMDEEQCPICFLYYLSLNRSRCCMKGICTECFLQLKSPRSTSPTQCPFCKGSNYAVEYRGERTKDEKGIEQIEEQMVIEAQIRLQRQAIQDERERVKRRQETCVSNRVIASQELEYHDVNNASLSVSPHVYSEQVGFVSSESLSTAPVDIQFNVKQNRGACFDMDVEDIMVMEAIWLSVQEQGCEGSPSSAGPVCFHGSLSTTSPSDGLACTVAAMAERQFMNGIDASSFASCGSSLAKENRIVNFLPSEGSSRTVPWEETGWSIDRSSQIAEAGTSYAGSDIALDTAAHGTSLSEGVTFATSHLLPESFEEQMMLAMAVSLAEASAVVLGQSPMESPGCKN